MSFRRYTYYMITRPNKTSTSNWVDAADGVLNMTPYEGAVVKLNRPFSAIFRRNGWYSFYTWCFSQNWFSPILSCVDEEKVHPFVSGLLLDLETRKAYYRGQEGVMRPCGVAGVLDVPAVLECPAIRALVDLRWAGSR